MPRDPLKNEHPHTYVVQDHSNQEELARLEEQDAMLNKSMGGVLSEQDDPANLRHVLDVGCGPGGWLVEVARTYPNIETLIGADISKTVVERARVLAQTRNLGERVQFQVMDALRRLEFSDAKFDLVNQRAGTSWLRTWDWRTVFLEYLRVTRPGGVIRVTEPGIIESNSPALNTLNHLSLEAGYHSGRFFAQRKDGLIGELPAIISRLAVDDVQTQVHTLVFRAGTEGGQSLYEDMARFYRVSVGLPFLQKYVNIPGDYQEIYLQALKEMQQPDFEAKWPWLVAWGMRPKDGQPIYRRGLM